MRYEIKKGKIVESFFIDAPYDTRKDAEQDLVNGVTHNCKHCCVRAEANARLIASAPEMLEALKEVIATTDDADWLTRFKSIIVKAEGRES